MLSPGKGQVAGKLGKHVDALVASGHVERFEDQGPRIRTTALGRQAIAEHGMGPSSPQRIGDLHAAGEFEPKTDADKKRWADLHAKPSKAKAVGEKPGVKAWAAGAAKKDGGGSDEFTRDEQGKFASK